MAHVRQELPNVALFSNNKYKIKTVKYNTHNNTKKSKYLFPKFER